MKVMIISTCLLRTVFLACTQILVSRADEEHCNTYLQLLDRVLTLEVNNATGENLINLASKGKKEIPHVNNLLVVTTDLQKAFNAGGI